MNAYRFVVLPLLACWALGCGGVATDPQENDVAGASCSLDSADRADLEQIFDGALTSASWIAVRTRVDPGYEEYAFGAEIPLTSLNALVVESDASSCQVSPKFEKHCAAPKVVGPEQELTKCAELACVNETTLAATLELNPVPFSAVTTPDGDVVVKNFKHAAEFRTDPETGELSITWETHTTLDRESVLVDVTASGGATIGGGMLSSIHVDLEIAGIGTQVVTASADFDGREVAGMAFTGDQAVALIGQSGTSWIGPCTP